MPAARIDLHIENLTLEGFDHRHQERLTEALQRELTELWTPQGPPPELVRAGHVQLDTARFDARAGDTPEAAAAGLARSIAESLHATQVPSTQAPSAQAPPVPREPT